MNNTQKEFNALSQEVGAATKAAFQFNPHTHLLHSLMQEDKELAKDSAEKYTDFLLWEQNSVHSNK